MEIFITHTTTVAEPCRDKVRSKGPFASLTTSFAVQTNNVRPDRIYDRAFLTLTHRVQTVAHYNFIMESGPMSVDSAALEPPALPTDGANEPKYGGHSRFELELEVRFPFTLRQV